jgi:hypothetical protein
MYYFHVHVHDDDDTRQLIAIRNLPSRSGGPQAISTHPKSQPKPEVLRPTRKSALPLIREAGGGGGGGAESSARLPGKYGRQILATLRDLTSQDLQVD